MNWEKKTYYKMIFLCMITFIAIVLLAIDIYAETIYVDIRGFEMNEQGVGSAYLISDAFCPVQDKSGSLPSSLSRHSSGGSNGVSYWHLGIMLDMPVEYVRNHSSFMEYHNIEKNKVNCDWDDNICWKII